MPLKGFGREEGLRCPGAWLGGLVTKQAVVRP